MCFCFFFFNKEPNSKSTNVLMFKLHLILQSQQRFIETFLNCIIFQEWFLLHTFVNSVALLLDWSCQEYILVSKGVSQAFFFETLVLQSCEILIQVCNFSFLYNSFQTSGTKEINVLQQNPHFYTSLFTLANSCQAMFVLQWEQLLSNLGTLAMLKFTLH